MKNVVRVMKALSDPSRLKIMKLLGEKELCVCEVTALLQFSQPTVSKHLKILEDAGLVHSCRSGSWVNYSLTDGRDTVYAKTMLANLEDWLNDDEQLTEILSQIPHVNRINLCPTNKEKR